MAKTYKATGINLKGMPIGESDRLLTVLTREFGVVRAVAPGSRKHHSKLGGRSSLFVVNQLLFIKGRNLDKIIQAESLESYPGLSQDLRKLTVAQYWAELALLQALSDQPQAELFDLFTLHLSRLEQWPGSLAIAALVHGSFQLLSLAGLSPRVTTCCVTQQPLLPDFEDVDWQVGFSIVAGGTVSSLDMLPQRMAQNRRSASAATVRPIPKSLREASGFYGRSQNFSAENISNKRVSNPSNLGSPITALELAVLQQLSQPDLLQTDGFLQPPMDGNSPNELNPLWNQPIADPVWQSIERLLRQYAQYHFDQPIRSATLIDTCFP